MLRSNLVILVRHILLLQERLLLREQAIRVKKRVFGI